MFGAAEFRMRARLDEATLDAWSEVGWLVPRVEAGDRAFAEIDVARARLIADLRDDLGLNDDGVTVALDLLDQIHGLRRTLGELLAALGAEPETTRSRIAFRMRDDENRNEPELLRR